MWGVVGVGVSDGDAGGGRSSWIFLEFKVALGGGGCIMVGVG